MNLYVLFGMVVALYYLVKNAQEYSNRIHDKELTYKRVLLGVILTWFLWPITIYNNEVRLK